MNAHALLPIVVSAILILPGLAELAPGDKVLLTLRGVSPEESVKISGEYRVGETGRIRLPLLNQTVNASGLTAEQFARTAESAYKTNGIYQNPAIEIEPLAGVDKPGEVLISIGGHVKRAGRVPFQKNMTVIQAIDSAGGRNEFASRNTLLLRNGKQYCLDFRKLSHKNIKLQPDDSLQIEQKSVIDRWKGNEAALKLLK